MTLALTLKNGDALRTAIVRKLSVEITDGGAPGPLVAAPFDRLGPGEERVYYIHSNLELHVHEEGVPGVSPGRD